MNANEGILMKMCFKLSFFSRGVILWRTIFLGIFSRSVLFFSCYLVRRKGRNEGKKERKKEGTKEGTKGNEGRKEERKEGWVFRFLRRPLHHVPPICLHPLHSMQQILKYRSPFSQTTDCLVAVSDRTRSHGSDKNL